MEMSRRTSPVRVVEIASQPSPGRAPQARRRPRALGFDEEDAAGRRWSSPRLATNLVKHARRRDPARGSAGRRTRGRRDPRARPRPGIDDVARALRDGYSTAGPGHRARRDRAHGRRVRHLYSRRGRGTARGATGADRPARGAAPSPRSDRRPASVSGRDGVCGDAWAVASRTRRTIVVIVDGLGHGRAPRGGAAAASARLAPSTPARRRVDVEARTRAMRATRAARRRGPRSIASTARRRASPASATSRRDRRPRRHARARVAQRHVSGTARKIQEFTYPWPATRPARDALRRLGHALEPRRATPASRARHPA